MVDSPDIELPEKWLRAVLLHSPDWLWILTPDGAATGLSPRQCAGSSLYRWVHENDAPALEQACRKLVEQRLSFIHTFRVVLPGGSVLWLEGKGYTLDLEGTGGAAVLSAKDITVYKQQEERLLRLAYHDALTGLPNRRLFKDRFVQALRRAKRYHHRLAVIYLDLDDFKRVNDTYGHATGDQLLSMTASRLSHSIREPDTVCRMGGDEFVLLLQQFEQPEDVLKIGRRLGEAITQPFDIAGQHITLTCSIGASFYPEDGLDSETLVQCADSAMYASKQHGKNHFQFYSES